MKLFSRIRNRVVWYYNRFNKTIEETNVYRKYYIQKSQKYKQAIVERIQKKDKVNVVFFVMNVGMWKFDGLLNLLIKSPKYNPIIVSYMFPNHTKEYRKQMQTKLESFFRSRNVQYFNCYDDECDKWLDIKRLAPDVIFYPQPYNDGYKGYRFEKLYKSVLFAYSSYGFPVSNLKNVHNALYTNVCLVQFVPSEYHKNFKHDVMDNKKANLCVTGYPLADLLYKKQSHNLSVWKNKDESLKRVIWAPHHTIFENEWLNYSTFLLVANEMLNMAVEYSNSIQFVFKPHPILRDKLYQHPLWGKEKTDAYYEKWRNMPNTCITEGEYIDLFLSSDALIHDCASFIVEYLYTNKPVMHIAKDGIEETLNEFTKKCFNQHYRGHTPLDIRNFIENVVLQEKDIMKNERTAFVDEFLSPPSGKSVAQNMFDALNNSLK